MIGVLAVQEGQSKVFFGHGQSPFHYLPELKKDEVLGEKEAGVTIDRVYLKQPGNKQK